MSCAAIPPWNESADPARVAAGELDRKPAELGRERDVRAEHLEVLGADDRDVDGVRDEPAFERRHHLLGDDQARAVLRLVGRGREVRGRDDVLEPEQLPFVRLGREDVERGARDLAGADRLGQRRLVDELASRGVDDPDAVSHLRDHVGADEPARVVGQRQVQRQEVGRGEDLLHGLGVVGAELAEPLRRDERVVADDSHAEPERPPGDLAADPAEAEHAERLVGELDAAPARALPAALLQRRVRLRDVAGERDEQPDRVLGRRDDGRVGCVGDDDSPPRRRVQVDVVDPDPGPPDHLQPLGPLDHRRGQLRRRADDDRVVAADDLLERRVAVLVDLEARAQQLDARRERSAPGRELSDRSPLPRTTSSARVAATPRSIGAPSSPSTSSTAESAVAMSNSSYQPMWPIRKIAPFSSPWPPAIVTP